MDLDAMIGSLLSDLLSTLFYNRRNVFSRQLKVGYYIFWKNDISTFVFQRRWKCCFWRVFTQIHSASGEYYDTTNCVKKWNTHVILSPLILFVNILDCNILKYFYFITTVLRYVYSCYLVCFSQELHQNTRWESTDSSGQNDSDLIPAAITRLTGFPILCKDLEWEGIGVEII